MSRQRTWELDGYKAASDEFFVTLDVAQWLGTETISSVAFSAKSLTDGTTYTSTVLDSGKNTYTAAGIIKPWIRAGTVGHTYLVTMLVTTNATQKESFYLQFTVKDY